MGHFFFFIVGTILGSFLNVCIHRLPRGESLLFPHPIVHTVDRLKWRDLAPTELYYFAGKLPPLPKTHPAAIPSWNW